MSKLKELKRRIVMLEEDNKLLSKIKDEEAAIEVERDDLKSKLNELTGKLASSESAKDMYRESSTSLNNELEQLHEVLDALPGSIPKREEDSYNDRSVLTRLAAWLGSTK